MSRAPPPPQDHADQLAQHVCERVKDLRRHRRWSLEQLAAQSGVSRSMLSQIERGEANPTIAVTSRIAQAFALSIGELLDGATAQPKIELIPTEDPAHIYRSDGQCYIRTLSPLRMEKDIEIYELRLKPGAMLDSAPHFKGSREFLTVLSGTIAVTSDTDRRVLKKGASAHYQADVAHRIENTGRGEAHAFLVVTYE